MCIAHIYLSVRDELIFFLNAGTLCIYRLVNYTQTSIYSHVHIYTWLKPIFILTEKQVWMHVFINIYLSIVIYSHTETHTNTQTHTRAFKVQNLNSAEVHSKSTGFPARARLCLHLLQYSEAFQRRTVLHSLTGINIHLCCVSTPHELISTRTQ